jgi:RNA polymerase sigma-70 factor (ECF subfamily)
MHVSMNSEAGSDVAGESRAEDRSLVEQCRGGNRRAFNRLVLKYQQMIVTVCVRLMGNAADGEDAAQETFVKAYRNLAGFKGEARFTTWLYQIALNTCRTMHRSWWNGVRKRFVRIDEPVESDEGEMSRQIGDTRFSPGNDLEHGRIAAAVQAGLAALIPIHRELIVLRDIEGLSYEEIGRITGLNQGTMKSRLSRARQTIQHSLKVFNDG